MAPCKRVTRSSPEMNFKCISKNINYNYFVAIFQTILVDNVFVKCDYIHFGNESQNIANIPLVKILHSNAFDPKLPRKCLLHSISFVILMY